MLSIISKATKVLHKDIARCCQSFPRLQKFYTKILPGVVNHFQGYKSFTQRYPCKTFVVNHFQGYKSFTQRYRQEVLSIISKATKVLHRDITRCCQSFPRLQKFYTKILPGVVNHFQGYKSFTQRYPCKTFVVNHFQGYKSFTQIYRQEVLSIISKATKVLHRDIRVKLLLSIISKATKVLHRDIARRCCRSFPRLQKFYTEISPGVVNHFQGYKSFTQRYCQVLSIISKATKVLHRDIRVKLLLSIISKATKVLHRYIARRCCRSFPRLQKFYTEISV